MGDLVTQKYKFKSQKRRRGNSKTKFLPLLGRLIFKLIGNLVTQKYKFKNLRTRRGDVAETTDAGYNLFTGSNY